MTDPAPTSGFCPIHVENFLALMDCFPPFLRTAATSFWVLALMRCRRFSTDGGLQRGQFYYGRDALARQLGISPKTILTLEKRLQNGGEIVRESTNERTTLTLLKFDIYVVDENKNSKRMANGWQTDGNKPNVNDLEASTPEKKKPSQVYPSEVESALKIWTDLAALPSSTNPDACRKTLSELHRIDKLSWDRINAICEYAARVWVPQQFIGSPVTLRGLTSKKDMKTWDAIERQLSAKSNHIGQNNGKHRPTPAEGGTVRLPYLITNGYDANPIKDPERRLETIKRRYPHLTKDPDQGFAWTLPDEAFK